MAGKNLFSWDSNAYNSTFSLMGVMHRLKICDSYKSVNSRDLYKFINKKYGVKKELSYDSEPYNSAFSLMSTLYCFGVYKDYKSMSIRELLAWVNRKYNGN